MMMVMVWWWLSKTLVETREQNGGLERRGGGACAILSWGRWPGDTMSGPWYTVRKWVLADHCLCSGLGRCCGAGLIPGLRTFIGHRCSHTHTHKQTISSLGWDIKSSLNWTHLTPVAVLKSVDWSWVGDKTPSLLLPKCAWPWTSHLNSASGIYFFV